MENEEMAKKGCMDMKKKAFVFLLGVGGKEKLGLNWVSGFIENFNEIMLDLWKGENKIWKG